jgi:hypothetical protein
MPRGWNGWAVLGAAQAILTFFLHILYRLAEHAMLGWGDEQISNWLGISSPTASTMIAWTIPFGLAAATLVIYHWIQIRFFRPPAATHASNNLQRPLIVWAQHPVIQWSRTMDGNVYVRSVGVTGRNAGKDLIQLEDAYLLSGITGARLDMKVVVPNGRVSPKETNPIPPMAPISVVTDEFRIDPGKYPSHMPENDFMRDWGALQFISEYEGKKHMTAFPQEQIKAQLDAAHFKPLKPHVTKRS